MRDWRGLSVHTYLGKYYVYVWDSVEEDLMSVTFDNAKERKKFLDALCEQDWGCPPVTDKVIATLPPQ